VETNLNDKMWAKFLEQGYLLLGVVADLQQIELLRQRIDHIVLGSAPVDFDRIMMQLDVVEGHDRPRPQTRGHKGATLNYRKSRTWNWTHCFSNTCNIPSSGPYATGHMAPQPAWRASAPCL